MGRYKSVLMAARDAKAFAYHVEVPVAGTGSGKRMDIFAAWLTARFGNEWRSHGQWRGGQQAACYMFRSRQAADLFEQAVVDGELKVLVEGKLGE